MSKKSGTWLKISDYRDLVIVFTDQDFDMPAFLKDLGHNIDQQ